MVLVYFTMNKEKCECCLEDEKIVPGDFVPEYEMVMCDLCLEEVILMTESVYRRMSR